MAGRAPANYDDPHQQAYRGSGGSMNSMGGHRLVRNFVTHEESLLLSRTEWERLAHELCSCVKSCARDLACVFILKLHRRKWYFGTLRDSRQRASVFSPQHFIACTTIHYRFLAAITPRDDKWSYKRWKEKNWKKADWHNKRVHAAWVWTDQEKKGKPTVFASHVSGFSSGAFFALCPFFCACGEKNTFMHRRFAAWLMSTPWGRNLALEATLLCARRRTRCHCRRMPSKLLIARMPKSKDWDLRYEREGREGERERERGTQREAWPILQNSIYSQKFTDIQMHGALIGNDNTIWCIVHMSDDTSTCIYIYTWSKYTQYNSFFGHKACQ